MDGHTLAFQKNNLVDSMVITVDTDETWQYKLDVKYSTKDKKGEELYNVIDLPREGNTCTVILQASMLPFNGRYSMQLRGISGDKVYHTDTFDVWVKYSIDPSKVYDPVPSEFYQVEANITELNNHPPKPGDNGYWMIYNVNTKQYEESDIPLEEMSVQSVNGKTGIVNLTAEDVGALPESGFSILDKSSQITTPWSDNITWQMGSFSRWGAVCTFTVQFIVNTVINSTYGFDVVTLPYHSSARIWVNNESLFWIDIGENTIRRNGDSIAKGAYTLSGFYLTNDPE